ncbi:FMN-binding protein [Salinibacterium sp. PAMC 21357]|uniref:FMN-binding protein n=1 Tax=Salinibacterium sp. PAMC 21357 TaxID=1112215 RepID=UPI0002888AB8|nr:FMN-binding protein [Salinibacterium sp. PAMC 21357]
MASASVLIVGYQAGTAVTTANGSSLTLPVGEVTNGSTSGSTSSGATTPETSTAPTTSTNTGTETSGTVASGPADGTYTGSSINTRFGAVQVQLTIAGGSISEVTALHLTDEDGRSIQISNRAAPVLRSEIIASQSTAVSNVSGATYTTQAYLASVQSALDQAGAS